MPYRDSKDRTLSRDVPALIEYLRPGIDVLDIGCGSGEITTDVARAVAPGTVIGVDVEPAAVESARETKRSRDVQNADFREADVHTLPFRNDTFDLVFSYTSAHFWWDPVRALSEQRRVAKPSGLVVTAGIRDFGFHPRYPVCEAWEAVWAALIADMSERHRKYVAGRQDPRGYWDFHAARKCMEWYANAGLGDPRPSLRVELWMYKGAPDLLSPFSEFMALRNAFMEKLISEAIDDGMLQQDVVTRAREEAMEWENNPAAFQYHTLLTIAGKA